MNQAATPEPTCSICRQTHSSLKKDYRCGICADLLCKKCARTHHESFFSFLQTIPEKLTHQIYCDPCYQKHVAPEMESYTETMARAKNLFVFEKKMKNVPVMECSKQKLSVKDCVDRKECILRLAFLAAKLSFNAIMNVEVSSQKMRNAGYQHTLWNATGHPAHVDETRLRDWHG